MIKAKTYKIPAGSHTAKNRFPCLFWGKAFRFDVTFDSSAVYETMMPENQHDINKLFGYSESLDHHKNSARFGWAFVEDKLRLYAYVYINGNRVTKELCIIEIGQTYRCIIVAEKNKYVFIVSDVLHNAIICSSQTIRAKESYRAFGYVLFPYFGGDTVCDHDIKITIQRL